MFDEPKKMKVNDADLLNRQEFVDELLEITESLASKKASVCYAINGEWGVGKTYIVGVFEERLRECRLEEDKSAKYLVFHYNCWKYDYYEEPLIAIVAAMIDQINEQTCLMSPEKKAHFIALLKTIGISMWGKACTVLEEKTGVNFEEIGKIINDGNEEAEKQIEENKKYDVYFDFKKTLEKLSETIKELSKEQTVIIVVDELDRCLPEYSIKLLERLHHIFDCVENVQVVLSVDKKQLENTVQQIYGSTVSVQHYLSKFINFEFKLTAGEVNDDITQAYKDYFDSFTYVGWKNPTAQQICTTLLKGIDIRTCKAILEKSFLCHRLLSIADEKENAAFLCVEVFLTLLKELRLDVRYAKNNFDANALFTCYDGAERSVFSSTNQVFAGLQLFSTYVKQNKCYTIENSEHYIKINELWGILLGVYRIVIGFNDDQWTCYWRPFPCDAEKIKEYAIEFWRLVKVLN